MMRYKKIFTSCIIGIISLLSITFAATVVIDPLAILNFPIIQGVNNYKTKQGSYMDVWKPYEFYRVKPDVIYIGSSRVFLGIKNSGESNIYNLGFSGLSLKDMEAYLKFVYAVHKPKKIYMGLDFFHFSEANFQSQRNGFSRSRLEALEKENGFMWLEVVKDNFQLNEILVKTVKESKKHKNDVPVFINGWFREKENAGFNIHDYYAVMNSNIKTFQEWKVEEESFRCLQRIVDEARKNNVELYVFFNPLHADMHALIALNDKYNIFFDTKKRVVDIIDTVYDFNFVNACSSNRALYIDPSHYLSTYGELIKQDMCSTENTERMYFLTKDNVNEIMIEEDKRIKEWMKENPRYMEFLKNKIAKNEKIEYGELKEYIGF